MLFVILGGMLVYQNFKPQDAEEPGTDSDVLQIGDTALYVADQRPGNSVMVNFASFAEPGFIVVRENDDGNFGRILGNSKVQPAGESRGIFIGLIRSVLSGESFSALIYEDSGDGVFTPGIDVPAKDEEGNVIFMIFNIDRSAPVNQEINL